MSLYKKTLTAGGRGGGNMITYSIYDVHLIKMSSCLEEVQLFLLLTHEV